ncbi:T9SS type B sorting domain-containing protein [Flavobacterium salilacus subsp. salilacus]|uniref:lectin-like domain-containing protein n=1 Tax=Flavobacterium TaxID=237 RepID=UPI001074F3EB|nr:MULTISPECIES: gliding motility-associated C-terminal domain-containing protein [Flavobacterium]KAF2519429.1 T9SS type B sorting domain-containing protein [Flavobacterium salilacus subsp. salilacus]MBE1614679.1 gliding motility-associated C-terminal domain-containing protein [Flavobacterium sp. SaA2.13]
MKKSLLKTLVITIGLMFSTHTWAQLVPSYVGNAYSTGDGCYVITPNLQQQAGAAWYDNPIDLNQDFDIVFNGFFGSSDSGADGMAFVLKTTANPVIGLPGEGLGYQQLPETPSLAVEFDTYQNSGGAINDPYYDHIALQKNGNTNHLSPNSLTSYVQASATSVNIENNTEHEVKIKWRAQEQRFIVIFDCNERINYTGDIINTVFGGESTVYFGFTASTGDATNQQSVCFQYLSFLESPLDDKTVCLGEAVTDIDGTFPGATNYQWSPATGVSNTNIADPTFTPDATTTYTLTITDNCGVVTEESFTITVIPNPDVTVTAAASPVCSGEDAVFNFSGTPDSEVTYTLNGGDEQTILLDDTGAASLAVTASSQQIVQLVNVALTEAPFCEADVTGSATVTIAAGSASFAMTPDCEGATATVTGDAGGTFAFNPVPADGSVIDSTTGTISGGTPGATYFVEYTVNGSCLASTIESVTLFPPVSYNTPSDLMVCDSDENDGFAEFNLNTAADQIEGGNTDLVVTFYESETEAENNTATDQLPVAFTNTVPFNQMIWVRIENSNTGCYAIESMQVTVEPVPVVNALNDLISCDTDNDGSVDFDLTLAQDEVLATNPNTIVTFYATQAEAETGNLATQLPLLYTTTAQESQIWVRVENATACYTTVALQLIAEPLPVLAQADSIEDCDDDNDGFITFDLTTIESQVTGNNPDITLTYAYEDNGELITISSPEAFQNTTADSQTIWISAENSLGCSTSVSFDIIVNKCFIQRGISPNSDGMNDSFDLTGFNVKEISVFNRYGVKVYTASNYTNEWHGQSDNGNELPTGTYFYSMSYTNGTQMSGEQKTGWIYINREIN